MKGQVHGTDRAAQRGTLRLYLPVRDLNKEQTTMAEIRLKPQRDRSVRNRHPWLFSGAIAQAEAEPGELVAVRAAGGEHLGWGYYNPASQIRVRMLVWGDAPPDEEWWRRQIEQSVALRAPLFADGHTNGARLVNAESDGLPGLVVDRYGEWLVLQALTLGIERRKEWLAELLRQMTSPRGIYERSDEPVRRLEGLEKVAGPLAGAAPPGEVEIVENGLRFLVNLATGHKTGFYLDQRENRALAGAHAAGKRVLNCFAYTGGFSIYAARAGAAHVTGVDTSQAALELAVENYRLNDLDPEAHEFIVADVFQLLRDYRREGRRFDLIVLDPPKFAHSKRDLEPACRGYKDINLHALQLLAPGGLLFTFSCSGLVAADLFQKVLFGASLDAGVEAQILQPLWQAADHPVRLSFPEGAYLKGFVLRRVAV
ncbi:MAG: class I SAM-dependent rRNA methyltransferase [Ardenticatenaceae bacterium]